MITTLVPERYGREEGRRQERLVQEVMCVLGLYPFHASWMPEATKIAAAPLSHLPPQQLHLQDATIVV